MERQIYPNNPLKIIVLALFIIFSSCNSSVPTEQELLDNAKFNFENTVFDRGIDKLEFKGPIVKKKIGKFDPESGYKVYGWFYIYKKDTIWVYAEVDTLLKKKTLMHFSTNINDHIEELDRRMK